MNEELIKSYAHKEVVRHRRDSHLEFLTSLSLFSSNDIDAGTNLLLRTIEASADRTFAHCLDIGCGYGVLGMVVAASGRAEQVEMVDRDALAVDFSAHNAAANGLRQVEAHGSLGLSDAARDSYDLIVSNLPGKAGSEVLRHLLSDAAERLSSEGQFWGVVVNPVWPELEAHVAEIGVSVIEIKQTARHTAFGFGTTGVQNRGQAPDSPLDPYRRGETEFDVGGRQYSIMTSRGVEEFDTLGYASQLLLEALYEMRRERHDRVAVFNVTQGYIPIALRAAGIASDLVLFDRDLLALKTARHNLIANGLDDSDTELRHQSSWPAADSGSKNGFSLVVGSLRGDEPREAVEIGLETVARSLAPGGVAVVAGSSTAITRMQKSAAALRGVSVKDRSRFRGSSVLSVRRTS